MVVVLVQSQAMLGPGTTIILSSVICAFVFSQTVSGPVNIAMYNAPWPYVILIHF